MIVRKLKPLPVEAIVRGYLVGSGWKEYKKKHSVCGIALEAGLKKAQQLPEPLFTPSTKAAQGDHDENISFEQMSGLIGADLAERLRSLSLNVYKQGVEYARSRGIIIADTKFEFGQVGDELILIDEVMTPDSSRFWPQESYKKGGGQLSFDKQFVRDWLLSSGWDRNSPPPELPADVVERTSHKYIEAFEKLTGTKF